MYRYVLEKEIWVAHLHQSRQSIIFSKLHSILHFFFPDIPCLCKREKILNPIQPRRAAEDDYNPIHRDILQTY